MSGSRTNVIEQPTLVQRACLVETGERDAATGAPVADLVLDPEDLADVRSRLGWEAADQLLIELADRLQVRLCPAGVTTHLDLDHLGIRCVGLSCDRTVAPEVADALATPLDVGPARIEVRPNPVL